MIIKNWSDFLRAKIHGKKVGALYCNYIIEMPEFWKIYSFEAEEVNFSDGHTHYAEWETREAFEKNKELEEYIWFTEDEDINLVRARAKFMKGYENG